MYAITAYDRALIDEAIAAGAVRHIPLGVSGINMATNAPWPSIDEAIAAHEAQTERLRAIYQSLAAEPQRAPARRSARHAEKQRMMADRNERIIALHAQGMTFEAVAHSVGMSKSSVYRICTGG